MRKKEHKYLSLHALGKSFIYALSGILFCLRTQRNAGIHFFAALAVIVAGLCLNVSAQDWRWLVFSISLVWFAELVNTAFEHLCDIVSPEFSLAVQHAKDVAAGAVLICAIGAACIGFLTFWPYLDQVPSPSQTD